jgi:hypothetical protein
MWGLSQLMTGAASDHLGRKWLTFFSGITVAFLMRETKNR